MAFCYFNGEFIEESNASISIHNIGLHRGFGVFDFFRSRNKKPTFINDYLERFEQSQKVLNLSRLISKNEIHDAVKMLQEKNGFKHSSFKLMLLADGSDDEEVLDPLFFIINAPLKERSDLIEARLVLHRYVRENPVIKSLNYFESYQIHRKKIEAKAIDVLFHTNGLVSETSRSNIFIIKDGVLYTPGRNILEGITRKHVLKVAKGVIETRIVDVSLDAVLQADEVFITSTLKEIMPVVKIEEQQIGDGRAGPLTLKLHALFLQHISNENSW